MYIKYVWYVLRHKWFVFVECLRAGIPWLGITHDWSKFSRAEFVAYARNFYGNYPAREDLRGDFSHTYPRRLTQEGVKAAFDVAWLHHQKANRHHWQYWILVYDDEPDKVKCLPMPDRYRREMLADWRGAGRAITGQDNTRDWYLGGRDGILLHPETRAWVEEQLSISQEIVR